MLLLSKAKPYQELKGTYMLPANNYVFTNIIYMNIELENSMEILVSEMLDELN